ncbi:helix-turn-helix transcriptional regulator [Humibacter sp.]|jgi:predicted transcriptional regulator YheO|uniref:helix-turn-helix transcriptional regulator n=1 Tax=Humibacter sp. TaxID=1940291 RepID=UPI002C905B69|nr:PAS domain-containing protein [Humibacter sp.]HVX07992.1 PAS domain-containing protein [Humibacter sp.]
MADKRPKVTAPAGIAPDIRPTVDGERLIAVFSALVEPLGRSLPPSTEVVLHDLSKLPNSIVAIHGEVTGRRVGDPATDLLLKKLNELSEDYNVGYETHLADGRRIRSSTMIIRDVTGQPVAALCLNSDLSVWESVQDIAASMLEVTGVRHPAKPKGESRIDAAPAAESADPEVFVTDVDQLAAHLIRQAVSNVDVPVELMQKRHKVAVVRDLKDRGMFHLRDAIDMIATTLGVTRFTIYNYLNEIADEDESDDEPLPIGKEA